MYSRIYYLCASSLPVALQLLLGGVTISLVGKPMRKTVPIENIIGLVSVLGFALDVAQVFQLDILLYDIVGYIVGVGYREYS